MHSKRKTATLPPLNMPSFRSETEEAQWYAENQSTLRDVFERVSQEGKLGHGTLVRRGRTPTTTIRLDPEDIALAKAQAEERGLRYQTYLKMILHQALQRRVAGGKVSR